MADSIKDRSWHSQIFVANNPLIEEWDFERNNMLDLDPKKITIGTMIKAYWKCPKCGYSWVASIQNRARYKSGCKVCKGMKILPGFNDLLTKRPDLMQGWDFDKNNSLGLFPYNVGSGTIRKAWWKCSNGHPSYYSSINSRSRGSGCAICANKRVLSGVNDLATTRPEMLSQWNYEKNSKDNVSPDSVTEVSGKKVWWKCNKGHEWQATIAHIAYGRGCPQCNNGRSTSFPEQAIFYYLKQIDENCINRFRLDNQELDIFIPSLNIGIEYNGYRWHDNGEKQISDRLKNQFFEDHEIKVLYVIEVTKKSADFGSSYTKNEHCYYVNDDDIVALNNVISCLVKDIFSKIIDVDIDKDRPKIFKSYIHNEESWSFASDCEGISHKWDYEKNLSLHPEHVSRRSGKIVYWICPVGHSFKSSVHQINHSACPICAREKQYNNRFEISHPELLEEWDFSNNTDIKPDVITCGSTRKVWWKCSEGHPSWRAPITSRVKGCGCPICGRKKTQQKRYKRVAQYNFDGSFVREWAGASVVCDELGIKHVSCVCNGNRNSAGGFIWKYIDEGK